MTIDGVGIGDPSAGYSDYNSAGECEIVVTDALVTIEIDEVGLICSRRSGLLAGGGGRCVIEQRGR